MRTLLKITALLSGLTAAVTFIFGAFMSDKNPWIGCVWKCSAVSGLVAFAIERLLAKMDERDTERLEAELDTAKQRVENLRADAEQERLSRLKLEAEIAAEKAPRTLGDEQKRALIERMKRWAGQSVLFVAGGDQECLRFLNVIRSILLDGAGWVLVTGWNPGGVMVADGVAQSFVNGVIIQCSQKSDRSLTDAAIELCKTLNEFGIASGCSYAPDEKTNIVNWHPDTLFIAVGRKFPMPTPQPQQSPRSVLQS